ncbi:hypothetical protein JCM11251_007746 [Rhodosporidiobolus azoricus]
MPPYYIEPEGDSSQRRPSWPPADGSYAHDPVTGRLVHHGYVPMRTPSASSEEEAPRREPLRKRDSFDQAQNPSHNLAQQPLHHELMGGSAYHHHHRHLPSGSHNLGFGQPWSDGPFQAPAAQNAEVPQPQPTYHFHQVREDRSPSGAPAPERDELNRVVETRAALAFVAFPSTVIVID